MPPEIVNKTNYDSKVDIWSSGVVAFVLLSGMPPFYANTKEEVYDQIKNAPLDLGISELSKISKDAIDFLSKVIEKDPSKRLSAKEALDHPWLKKEHNEVAGVDARQLEYVTTNLSKFCSLTQFQKMVVSILTSFKVQQEELKQL
jgi:calcium-dependent protein kinase